MASLHELRANSADRLQDKLEAKWHRQGYDCSGMDCDWRVSADTLTWTRSLDLHCHLQSTCGDYEDQYDDDPKEVTITITFSPNSDSAAAHTLEWDGEAL